jgi:hypothetical protein
MDYALTVTEIRIPMITDNNSTITCLKREDGFVLVTL